MRSSTKMPFLSLRFGCCLCKIHPRRRQDVCVSTEEIRSRECENGLKVSNAACKSFCPADVQGEEPGERFFLSLTGDNLHPTSIFSRV